MQSIIRLTSIILKINRDIRQETDQPVMKISLKDEDIQSVSVGLDDSLLASTCGTAVSFYDIRIGSVESQGMIFLLSMRFNYYSHYIIIYLLKVA